MTAEVEMLAMGVQAGDLAAELEPGSVAETMLVSLWGRVQGALRHPALLSDPMGVRLLRRLRVDFRGRFGQALVAAAVRAQWCDGVVRSFLARHPGAAVVALGEGLETQFWRVDDGQVQWLSVDLPHAQAVRRRLLPAHRRVRLVAASALEETWMQAVPAGTPVCIVACGLLMYLQPLEAARLLRRLGQRFPRGELCFDTVSRHVAAGSRRGLRLPDGRLRPAMPFGLDLADLEGFCSLVGPIKILSAQTYGEAARDGLPVSRALSRLAWLRGRLFPALVHCALGAPELVSHSAK